MRDTHTPKPHSSATALGQACAFLRGVGLPEAWAGLPQWRIVDTDFACGLNFLRAWQAWRADAQRPTLLHFVAAHAHPPCATDLGRTAGFDPPIDPALAPLVHELSSQWWGLLPGVHRLRFDEGRVMLTLHVSTAHAMLRGQSLTADSVYLHDVPRGVSDATNTVGEGGIWDQHAFKALARCCRRGTRLVCDGDAPFVRTALAHCGFDVAGAIHGEHHENDQVCQPPSAHLHATFNPAWEPRGGRHTEALPLPIAPTAPSDCLVIGAGLAGAAAAASLARRGWRVQVLDKENTPAAGASGLPAGVFAPHVSPDDSVLSRLSRSGVRTTLEQAGWVLQSSVDWSPCGVLERAMDSADNTNTTRSPTDIHALVGLPRNWQQKPNAWGSDWSQVASPSQLMHAELPATTAACWHHKAGWIRPARLVAALLRHPHIQWQGDNAVAQLRRISRAINPNGVETTVWQALDAQGHVLAEAPTVVIAAGAGSLQLLEACGTGNINSEKMPQREPFVSDLQPPGSAMGQKDDEKCTTADPVPPLSGKPDTRTAPRWPLQLVRGQISWGIHGDNATPLAPFPVNGHGNLVPRFALQDAADGPSGWVMGSTFERDIAALPPTPNEVNAAHAAHWRQLQTLLPAAATRWQAPFTSAAAAPNMANAAVDTSALPSAVQSWAAVRCTSPDRLPVVGPLDVTALPGLWACTAMGSRGLTLALLCGELLAARLQGEPLPLEAKLAASLGTQRLAPHADRAPL